MSILSPEKPLPKVGEAAYDLQIKKAEKIPAKDMQHEMGKSILNEIEDIIKNHKDYAKKYYILQMLIRERTMRNVIRSKLIVRKTRPRPDYDTSLFSFDNRTDELRYHWSIPDEGTCEFFLHSKSELKKEELQLLTYIEKFADGTLV